MAQEVFISLSANPRGHKRGASALMQINGVSQVVRLPIGKRISIQVPGSENAKYSPNPGSETGSTTGSETGSTTGSKSAK